MNLTYKITDLLFPENKIEEINKKLTESKNKLCSDFSKCLDDIRINFEGKINIFFNCFNEEIIEMGKTIDFLFKTQTNMAKISLNFSKILANFEWISNTFEQNLHFIKKTTIQMSSTSSSKKNHGRSKFSPVKTNENYVEKTIKSKNVVENIPNQEKTVITSPLLIDPFISEKKQNPSVFYEESKQPKEKKEIGELKINDDLEELRRKSSINSYEELIRRPRSITKNTRTDAFAKKYLTELYNKAKEMIIMMEMLS